MAERDEAIKLIIEIVDKFSKPLDDLKKTLSDFGEKDNASGSIKKAFDGLRTSISDTSKAIQGALAPALRGLGVGALSVTGAVTGLILAMRNFASSTDQLSRLTRETGISINKMLEWDAVSRRLGGSREETQQGFRSFYENMRLLKLGLGNTLDFINAGLTRELMQIRAIQDPGKQFEAAIDILDRIKEPAHRRKWLSLFGLPERWAEMYKDERDKVIAEWRKVHGPVTKAGEDAAKGFEDAIANIGNAWAGLMHKMAEAGTLDGLTRLINDLRELVTDPNVATTMGQVFHQLTAIMQDLVSATKGLGRGAKAVVTGGGTDGQHRPEQSKHWQEEAAKRSDPLPRTKAGWFTRGGQPVPLAKDVDELRRSLGMPPSKDERKDSIKQGAADGVVEAFTKMALGSDSPDGGGFGGASLIRASLGMPPGGGGRRPGGGGGPDEPVPGGGKANIPGNRRGVAGIVADEMRKAGMSEAAIAGIMANIGEESSFNPTLRHWDPTPGERAAGAQGEGTFAHGLFQERGEEWNNYLRWLKANHPDANWQDPRLQTAFLIHRMKTGYPGLWEKLKHLGPAGAANAFLKEYLKPAQRYQAERERQHNRGVPPVESYTGPPGQAAPLPPQSPPPKAVPRERLQEAALQATGGPTVEGNASLRVDLNGFPRGTIATSSASGIFSGVEMHRGRTLLPTGVT